MSFGVRHIHLLRRLAALGLLLIASYLGAAYLAMPAAWKHYERRHPALENAPRITHTKSGIPGDPLNVALIGSEMALKKAMLTAGWFPADPLTLRSCLAIATDTVLKRPYDDAPVSNLYLWNRKEDLAFEQPSGSNPRQRHHVRVWRSNEMTPDGQPLWLGAATYDSKVGLSHTTGQFTHHISADVDKERDHLFVDLQRANVLEESYFENNFHQIRTGKNGGGDPWHTDGQLEVGVLRDHP